MPEKKPIKIEVNGKQKIYFRFPVEIMAGLAVAVVADGKTRSIGFAFLVVILPD